MARLDWSDHYTSTTYETWGPSHHHSLQRHTISHYYDKPDDYVVNWSGTHVGTASTLAKAKTLAASDEKSREERSRQAHRWGS